MNSVLLIYQLVPEELMIFHLNIDNNDLDMLKQCHGKFVNFEVTPAGHPIENLHDWLEKHANEIIYHEIAGKIQVGHNLPDIIIKNNSSENITMIVTGFIL